MPNVPGQGILFPERAEELQQGYADYRMFVTFWRPLIDELATIHDEVAGQGRGRIVAIPGPQGAGKTAFASELQRNFDASKVAHREGVPLASGEEGMLSARHSAAARTASRSVA